MSDPDGAVMIVRLLVAAPLAATAVRAVADPLRARRVVAAWGVPERAVAPVVTALTVAGLLASVGLLGRTTAWFSAFVALLCLSVPVVFWLVSARGLDLPVRAVALAVPAVFVLWHGWGSAGPDFFPWLTTLSPVQSVAVLALALVVTLSKPDRVTEPTPKPVAVPLIRSNPELTIGMATYDDFDGVYFTLQALRNYHDLDNTELLVVDNFGCEQTEDLVRKWIGGTYVRATDVVGTAAPKDLVFRRASGAAVLCCDSHVLFAPGSIARLKRFYREHPGCGDLLQGPLVYDDGKLISTHFDPVWREQMWGVWATDPRGHDPEGEPFEIPMQGLGAFSCRSEAWLGFHPGFRGFGGEEGYLHEKYRQAGRRCLCLPWLRWMHRFGRPRGIPYPLTVEDKLRNYLLGHAELGLDPAPVVEHFSKYLTPDRLAGVVAATSGRP